eukprot:11098111-Ditylum_brightwellii.AAC.1
MAQDWRRHVKEGKIKMNYSLPPTMGYVIGEINTNCKEIDRDFNFPPLDTIDDKASVKTKTKMLSAISDWDGDDVNMSNSYIPHIKHNVLVKIPAPKVHSEKRIPTVLHEVEEDVEDKE